MKNRKIDTKKVILKRIEDRHKQLIFIEKNGQKNINISKPIVEKKEQKNINIPNVIIEKENKKNINVSMNERDNLRIFGKKSINKNLKNLSLEYNKSSNNIIGVLIVNLNNLELTKNCIDTLQKQINQNFKIYLFDQNSDEDGTSEFMNWCNNNNIIIYKNFENIPLNYLWNNFKNICNCEYLCFLNNDIELSNTFIDDTIKILDNEPKVGAVVHVTNNPNYIQTKNILEYKIFEMPRYQGWDYTIRRSIMPEIPKTLKIFGGDDYIFAKIHTLGYDVAIAFSSPIIHYKEKTRTNISNIKEIQISDGQIFRNLIKDENLKQAYSTLDDGICIARPQLNMKIIQNKNCVFTAIIGDYDGLISSIYPKLPDWDYICFTDNADIKSDFWRVIYINNDIKSYIENIKLARYYKTNFYKYLSSYENLIWTDARITITNDINEYLKNLEDNDIVFLKHPDASNILQEFDRVVKGNIEKQKMIDNIKQRYAEFGYNYDNGLISSGVMLFKNNKKTIKFFSEWWYEIENYSHRDQLSGNFVLWRNSEIKYKVLSRVLNYQYFKQLPRNTQRFKHE
jgi:hypothetical protein